MSDTPRMTDPPDADDEAWDDLLEAEQENLEEEHAEVKRLNDLLFAYREGVFDSWPKPKPQSIEQRWYGRK